VGWALDDGSVYVQRPSELDPAFAEAWADPAIAKSSHTLFDVHWFPELTLAGEWHDTRVMAWCISENTPLDLDWLVEHYVGEKMDKRLEVKANVVYFRDDRGKLWALGEMSEWPLQVFEEFRAYCARDVMSLRRLYKALITGMKEVESYSYWREEEVPFTPIVIEMEQNGMPINLADNEALRADIEARRDASEDKLRRLSRVPAVFNLGSPDQVSAYLFSKWFPVTDRLTLTDEQRVEMKGVKKPDRLAWAQGWAPRGFEVKKVGRLYVHGQWVVRGRGLKPTPLSKRRVNGEDVFGKHPSTSTPDLMYIHPNDPWVRELCLTYRRAGRLLTSYLEKFPRIAVEVGGVEGASLGAPETPTVQVPPASTRIYGRFNQAGTVTGRLSSSDPNMQNIPTRHEWGKLVRALFQGYFVIGDYDALEMRIMAHLSGDPEMLRIFREGLDPHARTAYALFGVEVDHDDERRGIAKTVNYGVGYGAGPPKLAMTLSIDGYATDIPTAKAYLKEVQGFYPTFFRYGERKKAQAKAGGGINTMSGRRRHLRGQFDELASWKTVMYGERQALNSEVQGSAADIIRRGMVCVKNEVLPRFPEVPLKTLAQIHDEAIWEFLRQHPPTREMLKATQWAMEEGHGYTMKVPLIFEPAIVTSWADKGAGLESSIEAFEEEARIA
jgi:DNA polymerase I-like protein with 3'-5' exonuclease and polymerase domains